VSNFENEEGVEYRADHIELDQLEQITTETRFYSVVVKKLMSRGSKVIVGPRGVGKTHHMRIAYKKCLVDKSKPFPIYVSFSKYLRLEPLKNTTAIAIQFFHCWVLSKILIALREPCEILLAEELNDRVGDSDITWDSVKLFCEQIEKQRQKEWHETLLDTISVSFVSEFIGQIIRLSGRKHAVLLCDDAALVLTQDYMIEFIDIFRSLKSTKISPKASVYPNTEFGPRFHIGHDAEPVPCWPSLLDDEYEELFNGIYEKRFSCDLKDGIKRCFMYASFGVPRAFINLINQYNLSSSGNDQQRVNTVITEQARLVIDEYQSQAVKQPQFKNFVIAGRILFSNIINEISKENKKALTKKKKQIVLGIKQDHPLDNTTKKNISIIIRLLEETGLLQKATAVKHGEDRVYDRYIPHFTLLLSTGAFQRGKAGYVNSFSESISFLKEKHPYRKNSFAEFDYDQTLVDITLDLPNCSACEKPRSSEAQKFCMFCGSELINKSTFETLVSSTIESLPITNWLKNRIKDDTTVETIGDIILAPNPGQELMKAYGIGKKKASKVIENAESWMDEYLS